MRAITYTRKYLAPWGATHLKELQRVFATLAFRSNTECLQYKVSKIIIYFNCAFSFTAMTIPSSQIVTIRVKLLRPANKIMHSFLIWRLITFMCVCVINLRICHLIRYKLFNIPEYCISRYNAQPPVKRDNFKTSFHIIRFIIKLNQLLTLKCYYVH